LGNPKFIDRAIILELSSVILLVFDTERIQ
jgi:hypothetical protein